MKLTSQRSNHTSAIKPRQIWTLTTKVKSFSGSADLDLSWYRFLLWLWAPTLSVKVGGRKESKGSRRLYQFFPILLLYQSDCLNHHHDIIIAFSRQLYKRERIQINYGYTNEILPKLNDVSRKVQNQDNIEAYSSVFNVGEESRMCVYNK